MICPVCREKLPAKFALATALTTVVCGRCHTTLRPTADSADFVARRMFPPSAKVGLVLGFAGTWYGLSTGRWAPLWIALGVGVLVSFVVSWRMAMKSVEFERA